MSVTAKKHKPQKSAYRENAYTPQKNALWKIFGSEFSGTTTNFNQKPQCLRLENASFTYDTASDVHFYGYRYYNPELGRFLSRDPVKEVDEYYFLNNDPINDVDLLGLVTVSIGQDCASISAKVVSFGDKDRKDKLLARYGVIQVRGRYQLSGTVTLTGEVCKHCCADGSQKRIWSGKGKVKASGYAGIFAGGYWKSSLFWEHYRVKAQIGIEGGVSVSPEGSGGFEYDECTGEGSLVATLSDTVAFTLKAGVEGYLKKRTRCRRGRCEYKNIAAIKGMLEGSVSAGLGIDLNCDAETCTLSSSLKDTNLTVEFVGQWKKKEIRLEVLKKKLAEGKDLGELTFDSPLGSLAN